MASARRPRSDGVAVRTYLDGHLRWAQTLVEQEWFKRIRELDLRIEELAMLPILASRACGIRHLELRPIDGFFDNDDAFDNGFDAILHHRTTQNLRSLGLRPPSRNRSVRDNDLDLALGRASRLPGLEHFSLWHTVNREAFGHWLDCLPGLRGLTLGGRNESLLPKVAESGLLARLESLTVKGHTCNFSSFMTREMPRLKSLSLKNCAIDVPQLQELLVRTQDLRRLDLSGTPLGSAGVLCICREPRMKRLLALNLEGCLVGPRDLEELMRSTNLLNLKWLYLGVDQPKFDPAIRAQLAGRYRSPGPSAFD